MQQILHIDEELDVERLVEPQCLRAGWRSPSGVAVGPSISTAGSPGMLFTSRKLTRTMPSKLRDDEEEALARDSEGSASDLPPATDAPPMRAPGACAELTSLSDCRRLAGSARTSIDAPTSEKPKTVMASMAPGNIEGHHWPVTTFWKPMAIMLPHSGVGARTPAPMKESAAVRRMPQPTLTESCASTGPMAFGMTWRRDRLEIGKAVDLRGLDIAHRADAEHLRAHQAQIDRRIDEGDGEHHRLDALAEARHQRDGEDEDRKGLQHVGGAHHREGEPDANAAAAAVDSRPARRASAPSSADSTVPSTAMVRSMRGA